MKWNLGLIQVYRAYRRVHYVLPPQVTVSGLDTVGSASKVYTVDRDVEILVGNGK